VVVVAVADAELVIEADAEFVTAVVTDSDGLREVVAVADTGAVAEGESVADGTEVEDIVGVNDWLGVTVAAGELDTELEMEFVGDMVIELEVEGNGDCDGVVLAMIRLTEEF